MSFWKDDTPSELSYVLYIQEGAYLSFATEKFYDTSE